MIAFRHRFNDVGSERCLSVSLPTSSVAARRTPPKLCRVRSDASFELEFLALCPEMSHRRVVLRPVGADGEAGPPDRRGERTVYGSDNSGGLQCRRRLQCALSRVAMPVTLGSELGGYQILSLLGEG